MERFPERVLTNVAAYLSGKGERALLAVALTAPSASWERRGVGAVPSAASQIVVNSPHYCGSCKKPHEEKWENLGLDYIDESIRRRLADGDLCGMLVCARSRLKKLAFPSCVNVRGDGLATLADSTVLEWVDLSLSDINRSPIINPPPELSEDAVVPILCGILDNEGNSLKYLRLPKAWRERKNGVLGGLFDKFNRVMNSRGIGCSKCDCTCIGTPDKPWIPHQGEDYGVQNFTCGGCRGHFCNSCTAADFGLLQLCPCCEIRYCTQCTDIDTCSECNTVSCGGCNYFGTCSTCDKVACKGCDILTWCSSCSRFICQDCQPGRLKCMGAKEKCYRSSCIDCIQKDTGDVKRCSKCGDAFCPQCKPVEPCSIIGGDVCPDCHRMDHSTVECHWQYLPPELKPLMLDFVEKEISLDRLVEFWHACVQFESFGTDKRFDLLAFQACVQAETSSYILALDYLSKGMPVHSLFSMAYSGFVKETYTRGPDYLVKFFQEESDSDMPKAERVCTYFSWLRNVVVETSTQAEVVAHIKRDIQYLESFRSRGTGVLEDLLGKVDPSGCKMHNIVTPDLTRYKKLYGKNIWMGITVSNVDIGSSATWSMYKDATLSWWLKAYTWNEITYLSGQSGPKLPPTTRYFRIVHKERTIFVSSSGKKTFRQLGIKDGDTITVGGVESDERTGLNDLTNEPSSNKGENNKRNKPKKKANGRKKTSKGSKKPASFALTDDEIVKRHREQHSKAMTCVLEELSPALKEIRNRLNDLAIHKPAPKVRKQGLRKKSWPQDSPTVLPIEDAFGGKAGKVAYPILVGEVSCLYKTTKLPAPRRVTTLDLHGCSREEALAKLTESLPVWVDTAMRREYPWVIPVDIVCGGGSQILAETVKDWIRRTRQVANRPKNFS